MIAADKRKAVFLLHQEGRSAREIARRMHLCRHSGRRILAQEGALPRSIRMDKIVVDATLLSRLYEQCDGWIQRVHEKLREEEGLVVKYSTLTRRLRELGISTHPSSGARTCRTNPGPRGSTTLRFIKGYSATNRCGSSPVCFICATQNGVT